jgi:hypothetical protein
VRRLTLLGQGSNAAFRGGSLETLGEGVDEPNEQAELLNGI